MPELPHKMNVLEEELCDVNDEQLEYADFSKLVKIEHLMLQLAVRD